MSKIKLEGRVVSIEISEPEPEFGAYGKKVSHVTFFIRNGSGKTESTEMPINVGDNKQLMKKAIIGQKVVFEKEEERAGGYLYITKRITIRSGLCEGVKYEHVDEY